MATLVPLLSASTYVVLAGTTITNSGPTTLLGDLGLSPGSAVVGFPPGTVSGTQHVTDAAAAQAQLDLTAAYLDAAGQTPVVTIASELGATTQTPGTYDSGDGTFAITGDLTLDGGGDPDAVFIFKMATTLITAAASTVILTNGASAANVFWQVGSSATLGAASILKGTILALTSIALDTGAVVEGRVLARNGEVTFLSNFVYLPIVEEVESEPEAPAGLLDCQFTMTLVQKTRVLELVKYLRQSGIGAGPIDQRTADTLSRIFGDGCDFGCGCGPRESFQSRLQEEPVPTLLLALLYVAA